MSSDVAKLYNETVGFAAPFDFWSDTLEHGMQDIRTKSEMSSFSSVDFDAALSRMGNDWQLFREVAAMIMEDYELHLRGICDATDRDSWDEVKKHAHALRGIVSTYQTQGQPYSDLLALESAAERGQADRIHELRKRITDEMQRFVSKIQLFLETSDDERQTGSAETDSSASG